MVEGRRHERIQSWYLALDETDQFAVRGGVGVREQMGVALGAPRSSAIKGSRFALRELRIQSGGRPLRVFYAFDPHRNAVLIIGGDKTGDGRFYESMVPLSEKIWEQYLAEQAAGEHGD